MIKNNFFVLTGAMGAGKTTVLNELKKKFKCVDEPARKILKEQREISGDGVPEKNTEMFNNLMLSEMIAQYKDNTSAEGIVFFDRGVPDIIAYAELLTTSSKASANASVKYRYNKYVFMFNGWEEIYINDDERIINFNTAKNFGMNVKKIYIDLGYEIIDVPFLAVEERVSFILNEVNKIVK